MRANSTHTSDLQLHSSFYGSLSHTPGVHAAQRLAVDVACSKDRLKASDRAVAGCPFAAGTR